MTLLADRTTLVSRAEWGARRPKYTTKFTPSYGTTIHWEGPSMPDFPHSACASYVRGIQAFHMDSRGWADIAYTAVVCPHGYTFEGRWIGNRTGANGTNVGNDTAYAVCFLGGVGDPYTTDAHNAMHDTTTHLRLHGGAGRGVNCHRDWKSTQCPGDVICGRVKEGFYTTDSWPDPFKTAPIPAPSHPIQEEDMAAGNTYRLAFNEDGSPNGTIAYGDRGIWMVTGNPDQASFWSAVAGGKPAIECNPLQWAWAQQVCLGGLTAESIAEAVVKAIPPTSAGGLTEDQIKSAALSALEDSGLTGLLPGK